MKNRLQLEPAFKLIKPTKTHGGVFTYENTNKVFKLIFNKKSKVNMQFNLSATYKKR